MTFEQFKKNVEKVSCLSILSLSTTEFMILHEVSVRESRTIMGNIFQPYHTVEEIHVPSFLLVCRNAAQSEMSAIFKKQGYPVLNTARIKLPSKKETKAFVDAFVHAWLQQEQVN
jgi:hypothetical protein